MTLMEPIVKRMVPINRRLVSAFTKKLSLFIRFRFLFGAILNMLKSRVTARDADNTIEI